MRVIFAGGGTGGHINPAISIADYAKKQDKDFEALFIGTEKGLEKKLVPAAGYKIKYIDIAGFDRRRLWRNVSVVIKLVKSRMDCRKIIREFKPDAVVCTGGYVSGPVAMAAKKEYWYVIWKHGISFDFARAFFMYVAIFCFWQL